MRYHFFYYNLVARNYDVLNFTLNFLYLMVPSQEP